MLVLKKAYILCRLFLFSILTSLLASCAAPNKTFLVSGIDSQYRLKNTQLTSRNAASSTVNIYQSVVSRTLASECKYFPSDSAYSQIISKKCGSFHSLMKTFDRFLRESDVAFLGSAMIPTGHKYRFLDIPEDCDYL